MSDEVTQAFATLRRHLPASLRAQGAALEAAWFNGGPLHRRTREPAAPEGVDAADEQERLREELGLEAGMRTGAVDELESLRRELWQLINADQLSDQDTLSQLRYQCSLVRHWHDRYEQLRARDEAVKAVVDQAELTCAVVKRVLNADASEGTPIWEWTDEEAETGVREVLLAGEELAAALDDVHEDTCEGVDAADELPTTDTEEI